MKLLEKHLEQQITDFLALDSWRSLKTDPVRNREWGKGFGEKGMPDRLYLRYEEPRTRDFQTDLPWHCIGRAEVMFIEFKRRGKRAEPHQKAWHVAERARGALVLVAGEDFPATYEGFLYFYRQSGFLRREGLC